MNESAEHMRERLEQEAVAWHTRLTSGEPEAAERIRFEAWRAQSPTHAKAYRKIEKLWQMLGAPLQTEQQRRQSSAVNRRSTNRKPATWRIGLAIAAVLLLALTLKLYPDYLQAPWADYRTHIGEQTTITLADGSTAYLNTDTALDVSWSDHERRIVLLRGEAEFEVTRDNQRPFRVVAGNTRTEALGTHFIVRYDGESGMVTLLEGKVRTSRYSARGELAGTSDLKPGERVTFNHDALSEAQSADLSAASAWRRGRLSMNFVTLQQVIAEINRYRRGQVKLIDKALANREINAAIDLNHIDDWLDALQDSLPIHTHRAGPFVLLSS